MLAVIICMLALSQPTNINDLIDAIGIVESNNNDNAVGDGGLAIGRYQIHKAYWQDGCRFLGVKWPYEEAKNEIKARQVVRAYFLHYGCGKTLEQNARIHNGGPKGHLKPQTEIYRQKIEKVMKAKSQTDSGHCVSPLSNCNKIIDKSLSVRDLQRIVK